MEISALLFALSLLFFPFQDKNLAKFWPTPERGGYYVGYFSKRDIETSLIHIPPGKTEEFSGERVPVLVVPPFVRRAAPFAAALSTPLDIQSSDAPDVYVIPGATLESFEVLSDEHSFARDKGKVFHMAEELKGLNGNMPFEIFVLPGQASGEKGKERATRPALPFPWLNNYFIVQDGRYYAVSRLPLWVAFSFTEVDKNFAEGKQLEKIWPSEMPPLAFLTDFYLTDGEKVFYFEEGSRMKGEPHAEYRLMEGKAQVLEGLTKKTATSDRFTPKIVSGAKDVWIAGKKQPPSLHGYEDLNSYWQKSGDSIFFKFKPVEKPDGSKPDAGSFQTTGGYQIRQRYGWDKNDVYYAGRLIPGADGQSFKVLNDWYAADKNQAYYAGKPIEGVDPATFTLMEYDYAMDKHAVYKEGVASLTGINTASLENIGDSFIKDSSRVWYWHDGEPLQGVNAEKFRQIDWSSYGTDGERIYLGSKLIEGAHVPTFSLEEALCFGYDKYRVYYWGEPIPGADPKTFQSLSDHQNDENPGERWAKDKNFVYYAGEDVIFKGADPATFKPVNDQWAVDATQVWFNYQFTQKPVEGMSPEDFTILDDYHAKSKSGVYGTTMDKGLSLLPGILPEILRGLRSGEAFKIEGADPATFNLLGDGWAMDKTAVYFEDKRHEGTVHQPGAFKVFYGKKYATDGQSVWYKGELVQGADSATFKVLWRDTDFSVDAGRAYYMGLPISGALPKTFRPLQNGYSEDGHGYFFKTERIPALLPENQDLP